jgi:D-3-phosphoglycerate dehydrogenase
MTAKILVTNATLAAPAMALLEKRGAKAIFLPVSTPVEEVRRVAAREAIDAIISRTIRLDGETMDASPRLKVISKHAAGYDNIDVAAATARGIPVLVALAGNARSVAEHTLSLMLALAKRLRPLDAALRRGEWPRESGHGVELYGKELGIVGFGSIGRLVAELAGAFGMRVSCYGPNLAPERAPSGVTVRASLAELLATADFVSLHCPLTPTTRGLIGEKELQVMKPSAFLVNTARGPVVEEGALIAALSQGQLAGAALDCFVAEPAPPDSPLWRLPNTIYTPHIAGVTEDAFKRVAVQAVENAFAILDGVAPDPRCVVNREVLR